MKHDWSGGRAGDHECVQCGAWTAGYLPVSSLPQEGCPGERILYSRQSQAKMHALEPGESRITWQINLAQRWSDKMYLVWKERFHYRHDAPERLDLKEYSSKEEAMQDYQSRNV